MKLSSCSSSVVRNWTSETLEVILTRPMSRVCGDTCLDTGPVSNTCSVPTSRGWGSLPHPGLCPLLIGDSNLSVPVARAGGDSILGDSNLLIPTLQGEGAIVIPIATYSSCCLYDPSLYSAATSRAEFEVDIKRISGLYSDCRRLITCAAGSPGHRLQSTPARIADYSFLAYFIVGHCQLFVISLFDGEVLLTDPLFTPRTNLYPFCALFIDTGRINKTSVTPAL